MPTYASTQPEIFTSPPEKSISEEKKSGQLTDEQVKQYFDEVKPTGGKKKSLESTTDFCRSYNLSTFLLFCYVVTAFFFP